MMSMFILLVIMFQYLCGIVRFILWDTWFNHFESLISYIWFSSQPLWEDWGVLNDFFLMMSCCDMFDLTILESLINIILRYYLVACWEPMDIVIYFRIIFGSSLRTDGYCDLSFDAFQLLIENWCDYYDYLYNAF